MQLYSIPFSPYAARCRIQIYHKSLPVEIVPPPGGLGSAQIKAKNPLGKIPILDLGDRALAESWAIMEYLESCYPIPSMRPADMYERARMQMLVRHIDLYLAPAMFPLFRFLRGATDHDAVSAALATTQTQLQILEQLLAARPATGLDLGDAALLPVLWYVKLLTAYFGVADCLSSLPATEQWWHRASAKPAAARVLAEMETGLRASMPALFEIRSVRTEVTA